jgi:hypothetical protein
MRATSSVAGIEPADPSTASALLVIADELTVTGFESRSPIWGLPTELPVACRQNSDGGLV